MTSGRSLAGRRFISGAASTIALILSGCGKAPEPAAPEQAPAAEAGMDAAPVEGEVAAPMEETDGMSVSESAQVDAAHAN